MAEEKTYGTINETPATPIDGAGFQQPGSGPVKIGNVKADCELAATPYGRPRMNPEAEAYQEQERNFKRMSDLRMAAETNKMECAAEIAAVMARRGLSVNDVPHVLGLVPNHLFVTVK